MLSHLHMGGQVMVVGHRGHQNLWGLSSQFLPEGTDRRAPPPTETERWMAERAFQALGVASASEVKFYFVRGRYLRLAETLLGLEKDGVIRRVEIEGWPAGEPRYVLAAHVPMLEALADTPPEPRMSLLPPFDTMLSNQARTRQLFGFQYVREQFLPPSKRRYGTYVLPILWGDRFIGRIDPKFEPATRRLLIHSVHAEADAPRDPAVATTLAATIARFADYLGATEVVYAPRVPKAWAAQLH